MRRNIPHGPLAGEGGEAADSESVTPRQPGDSRDGGSADEFGILVRRGARSVRAVAPLFTTFESLQQEVEDSRRAERRGYFKPDEDERVGFAFARYLAIRASLFATINDLRPSLSLTGLAAGRSGRSATREGELEAFAVCFCAATLLVRAAGFVVEHFGALEVVWRKLDQADDRFGIPPKQFTAIYRSLTRPFHVFAYGLAVEAALRHRRELEGLGVHPMVGPLVQVLVQEWSFIEGFRTSVLMRRRRSYWKHALERRSFSGLYQGLFGLMEVAGRAVSEMRNPFHRKRVTTETIAGVRELLRPGDVLVTRHDDAASNLFLPGFWPHAAFYIGTDAEREALDLPESLGDGICVLEAKKDGVLTRRLESTLEVDAFVIIRPHLRPGDVRKAIERGLAHEGKLYDFNFDFARSDRLACTEVVYRALHGVDGLRFRLHRHGGRLCLTAEDLLERALAGRGFDVVAVQGVHGAELATGPAASAILARTLHDRPAF